MTKELLDLSTRQFAALLLRYSPQQSYTMVWDYGEKKVENTIHGTYQQILAALSGDRLFRDNVEESMFDYALFLEETDVIKYVRFRTEGFDPDLTQAFKNDLKRNIDALLNEAKDCFTDANEFELWKTSASDRVDKVFGLLSEKCNSNLQHSTPKSDQSTSDDVTSSDSDCSSRMQKYLAKAGSLFVNDRWKNNDRLEYAIFLKVLYCKVYRKDWTNNVRWTKIALLPLADGTRLNSTQLGEAMKKYDDSYDWLKTKYERILG